MFRPVCLSCCITLLAASLAGAAPQSELTPAQLGEQDRPNPARTAAHVHKLLERAARRLSQQDLAAARQAFDEISTLRRPYRDWIAKPRDYLAMVVGPLPRELTRYELCRELGKVCQMIGATRSADACYIQAILADPRDPLRLAAKVSHYRGPRRGDQRGAKPLREKLPSADQQFWGRNPYLGNSDQFPRRLEEIVRLEELLPHLSARQLPRCYEVIAKLHFDGGDLAGHKAWEDTLREALPGSDEAVKVLLGRGGRAEMERQDWNLASRLYQQAWAEGPGTISGCKAKQRLAAMAIRRRDWDAAVAEYRPILTVVAQGFPGYQDLSPQSKANLGDLLGNERHAAALGLSRTYEAAQDYGQALHWRVAADTTYPYRRGPGCGFGLAEGRLNIRADICRLRFLAGETEDAIAEAEQIFNQTELGYWPDTMAMAYVQDFARRQRLDVVEQRMGSFPLGAQTDLRAYLGVARLIEAGDRAGLFRLLTVHDAGDYQLRSISPGGGWVRDQALAALVRLDGAEAFAISQFGQSPTIDGWALLVLARCKSHHTIEHAQRLLAQNLKHHLLHLEVCHALATLGTPRAALLLKKIAEGPPGRLIQPEVMRSFLQRVAPP